MGFIVRWFKGQSTGPMVAVGAGIGLTAVLIFHSAGSAPACASRCGAPATVATAPAPLDPVDPEPSDVQQADPAAAPAVSTTPSAVRRTTSKPKNATAPLSSPTTTVTTRPVAGDHGESGGDPPPPPVTTTTAPLLPVQVQVPGL